ncbi:MAG: ATP-dependent helicase/nuclease subunit, partial [Acidimicrobiaceae bacterium]|nr:ATP-dependent helicase/nuclease subunit [Acidimicrobiaceae bacterium]
MTIRVDWVSYGRSAADALRKTIAAIKGDEPLAPLTVVVPSNHVGVATRRLLASGKLGPTCSRGMGLVAVTFVTPYRLAELLGAPTLAATGRRPVSTPVIAAALRASLAEAPGLFAAVAAHPATETALVASYRELREVSHAGLNAIAATSPRAADVVRLHRATRARLKPAWYDEQDLMRSAASVLTSPGGAPSDLGAVVIFLPQRVSPHGQVLFTAAARSTDVFVLAGYTGDPRADADVLAATRRLSATVEAPPTSDPHAMASAQRTRIVLASDADDEARVAARAAIEAVRRGVALDRIAILHASAEPYARLAHEHLAAAGIKTNGPAVVPLAGRVAGRALLEMLALPARGFRRQDVFSWLTTAPVLRDGTWAPVVAWERLSRDAGIVGGRHDWDERLTRYANDLDERATAGRADAEQPAWRSERDHAQAQRARELAAFVLGLMDDLTVAASTPRPWSEHAAWARRHLHRVLGGAGRRETWPDSEARAAERVE